MTEESNVQNNRSPLSFRLNVLDEDGVTQLTNLLNSKVKVFSSAEEVDTFLRNVDTKKNNSQRFLAYLFKTGVIQSFENIGSQLTQLIQTYAEQVNNIYGDEEDPLKPVEKYNETPIIEKDIPRSFPFFKLSCEEIGMPLSFYEHCDCIGKRLLAMASLSDNTTFSYTQGFDRWMLNSLILSLEFCREYEIESQYAEGLCYELFKHLLRTADINYILQNSLTYEPFTMLNTKMYKVRPDISDTVAILYHNQAPSILYALRWRLLMFADDFDIEKLLIIWDNVLLHLDDFDHFFFALALAQVCQVDVPEPSSVIESLQKQRTTDIERLIKQAYVIYDEQEMYTETEEDREEQARQERRYADEIARQFPQIEEEKEETFLGFVKEHKTEFIVASLLFGTGVGLLTYALTRKPNKKNE